MEHATWGDHALITGIDIKTMDDATFAKIY